MPKDKMFLPAKWMNSSIGSQLKCEHTVTDDAVDLQFYGVVGEWWDGITSQDVGKILAKNRGKRVNVSINSPGGYATEGVAIYNLLSDHNGHVTTTVIGDASSAASHILMAGDTRRMKDNASFLIHRSLGAFIANAGEMRAIAEDMDLMDRSIATVYAGRAGKTVDYWLGVMAGPKDRDGTTFSPSDALAAGLIDEILPTGKKTKQMDPDEDDDEEETTQARRNLRVAVRARAVEIDNFRALGII